LVLAKALPGASGSLALKRMQIKIASGGKGSILVRSREGKMEIPVKRIKYIAWELVVEMI
jgi:hypothetical protein